VLAIAILGIVMVKAFSEQLNRELANRSVPTGAIAEIRSNETKLAGLQAPAGIDDITKAAIRDSVAHAFVYGFRIVMIICAGLSLASAAVAWRIIAPITD
jgi:hypothetical protein